MTAPKLPPLAHPTRYHVWTEAETKAIAAYALAAYRQGLEDAARVCEQIDDRCPDCLAHNDHEQCTVPTAAEYAAACRAQQRRPECGGDGL